MDQETRNYRAGQLEKLGHKKSIYRKTIKITSEEGSTNYMDITEQEYKAIKKILTGRAGK